MQTEVTDGSQQYPLPSVWDIETAIIEPAHEIMTLIVVRKFILQIPKRSHPVG